MRTKNIFAGNTAINLNVSEVQGRAVTLDGEEFYCIAHHDRMRPFFMTIVRPEDQWMFISSNGSLTAGRRNADLALFPYYTDDKIHDGVETTGPKTILLVEVGSKTQLWEPFTDRYQGLHRIQRNIYKNFSGNKVVFEEINLDLGLVFCYGWVASGKFGWVRNAKLSNISDKTVKLRLLDGLQNLMPCGIDSQFQMEKSTLIDAYKKNELLADSGLGLFLLSSVPVDRPEPAESLRATTVWSAGLDRDCVLLSSVQLNDFRKGLRLKLETDVRAERGAYLVETSLALGVGKSKDWLLVAEVDQSPSQVAAIRKDLRFPTKLSKAVELDIEHATDELRRIVGSADGLQKTSRTLGDARHFSNVLFNVMRGGVFLDGYRVEGEDLQKFVSQANQSVASRQSVFFRKIKPGTCHEQVMAMARKTGDSDLERLCREYLPLTFSRRHGDPSRPWNRFSIAGTGINGRRILNYEGNWRDIFQNWEALAISFPGFAASMVAKFVNSSTADGYNPYRITRGGVDWEVLDPRDPWSHIGYWGDHQIIYLLKLLEIVEQHQPAVLRDYLTRELFSFANVPYRIKSYGQLLENPRETVDFDFALEEVIRGRVAATGSDGKMIWDSKNRVVRVNLTEKLLIQLLAKFANFIPGAGVWLNTQRPEWNDANNALVGNGVSMVTAYHLRRHLLFCLTLFQSMEGADIVISGEVQEWFLATVKVLSDQTLLAEPCNPRRRKKALDSLETAATEYRSRIYSNGFSGTRENLSVGDAREFFRLALDWVDVSILENRRQDGLYHSYNLVDFSKRREITVSHLQTMLEGQSAVLGANILFPKASLDLLTALRQSNLYRGDQNSYLLYPDRSLHRFVEKNNLPVAFVNESRLLTCLIRDGNHSLIERDVEGVCHFNTKIINSMVLRDVLKQLTGKGYAAFVKQDSERILELYEKLFDHKSFTGRSGTFFGYEGLGCIYWHMVSKLLLSAQESFCRADGDAAELELSERYHDIRAGIGDMKSPLEYGAFPMDPYSHTPGHTGARQPGLTGQVKEDILCRFGELGVKVKEGRIHFQPRLLRVAEFLEEPSSFTFYDLSGAKRKIRLNKGSLAFTYCQVPVIYELAKEEYLTVQLVSGKQFRQDTLVLDETMSRSLFERLGEVSSITCGIPHKGLTPLKISAGKTKIKE